MTRPIITVENLSKAYRIGQKEEIPDNLVAAMTGWLTAPVRNWRNLRRLNTFDEPVAEEVKSQESRDKSQTESVNGNASAGSRLSTLDSRPCPPDTLWALRDVSFDVHEGEVVGIIGRNGAGKSTLLKILSRITEPTHGRAVIRGRISSLLEVGTGFHPELSGRENIYMNGTILGMRKKEIDRKFDEIVDFSGVERFLDTPIKRYSSGMQVRLAFAVAAHLEPEILIIDEVLAVGDAEFQKKCLGKMQDVARGGRTVLFVSHNMAAVEALCTCAMQMSNGTLISHGDTSAVLGMYRHAISDELSRASLAHRLNESRFVRTIELLDSNGYPSNVIPLGGSFRLRIQFAPSAPISNPLIGIGIDALGGGRVLSLHTPYSSQPIGPIASPCYTHCEVTEFPLPPGEYTLKLVLTENRQELESLNDALCFTVVDGDAFGAGRGFHRGTCIARSRWFRESLEVN